MLRSFSMNLARFALLSMLAAAVGCGAGAGAVPVSGAVTLDGQPVATGEIVFTPADPQVASIAAKIEDGKYSIALPKGKSQVRITAYREVPGKVDTSNPGEQSAVVEMYIPAEYNSNSTLEVTVDSANEALNFPLGKS